MKLSFKNILIIFLVALLGSSVGTIVAQEIYKCNGNTNQEVEKESSTLNISQVNYGSVVESDYAKTINKVFDTVVEVHADAYISDRQISGSAGSGVIISSDGYIITNNHVVKNANVFSIKLSDGSELDASLIGADPRSDIALIKVEANNLEFASFADSDQIYRGQQVVAIGNPLGEGITCSEGIISALTKDITIDSVSMELMQTTAAVNEGNSGGGLFDLNGNIVGIVNAKSSTTYTTTVEGMGYAIPSNRALKVIQDLKEYGFVKDRATLGVKVYTSNYYSSAVPGVTISEIVENGAAEEAGLKAGDIITAIDGVEITSYTDMTKVLSKYVVGDTVIVTISRDGKTKDYKLHLQEATND